jgi:hypothetical protein
MRLSRHIRNYKVTENGGRSKCSSYEILKNNDYDIVLLENYSSCNNNKDELLPRERYYIDLLKPINKIKVPKYTDDEERRKIKNEGNNNSYHKYAEEIKTKRKENIVKCDCGIE